ncbi:hypothetical protein B0T26DRAFT_872870 [Lasiosphaeria miniovina]|uniref:Alcohol dehydrogenase-like N-terminal domain-containing protein n=1 Tax=Lasiosphaeria miniovina TaxID=1954250 RepID=A0AA40DQK5_9PEZI|nr:uncharacterized protein B0T26DRAFT_872870 [Lasiosphaeria miniovina]KAK0712444.1 hypothetical protein B0T26DRAFT_872870 [Lasiosphaeria miniovina]
MSETATRPDDEGRRVGVHAVGVAVCDVPKPTIRLLRTPSCGMMTAGVCGSDVYIDRSFFGSSTPPWGLSEEVVGIMAAVGGATEPFKVGDGLLTPAFPLMDVDPTFLTWVGVKMSGLPSNGAGDDTGGTEEAKQDEASGLGKSPTN